MRGLWINCRVLAVAQNGQVYRGVIVEIRADHYVVNLDSDGKDWLFPCEKVQRI